MAEDLTVMMARRCEEYARLACTVVPLLAESTDPARALAQLLMDAYRDGGRDMHQAVQDVLSQQETTP